MTTAGAVAALVGFVAMEPITYATHRWVMHGRGMRWHRSHHRPTVGRLEANDGFPVVFALIVGAAFAVGFQQRDGSITVGAALGITAYGAAYAFVHDLYIHDRLHWFRGRRPAPLERLGRAHQLHHRFGGEPYGMLLPIVPAALRARDLDRPDALPPDLVDR